MFPNLRRVLLGIEVKYNLVFRDDGVGLKDRVEWDILAAHVEEPSDLVKSGENGRIVAGLSEAASER